MRLDTDATQNIECFMNHILNPNPSHTDLSALKQHIAALWQTLQTEQPLVQCITNSVASNFAANVVLAIGASPAMIDNPFEAQGFAKIAGALSLNTGTPTTEQIQAMHKAVQGATEAHTPWVLDPVGYGDLLQWRSETIRELLPFRPQIIRGNASEIAALAGTQSTSKGVDSTLDSAHVIEQATSLLDQTACVAISGATDYILSQEFGVISIHGGSPLQPKITAMGCALGAVCAAYHAVTDSSALAAIAAHSHFALAAKKAQDNVSGIGTFQVAFLDALFQIRNEDFLDIELQYHELN